METKSSVASPMPTSWTTRACSAIGQAVATVCNWVHQACAFVERQFTSRSATIVPAPPDPRSEGGAAVRENSESKASDSRGAVELSALPTSAEEASRRAQEIVADFVSKSWAHPGEVPAHLFESPFEGRPIVEHALVATGRAVLEQVARDVVVELQNSARSASPVDAVAGSLRTHLALALAEERLPREFLAILKAAYESANPQVAGWIKKNAIVPDLMVHFALKPIVEQGQAVARVRDKTRWNMLAEALPRVAQSPGRRLEVAVTKALAGVVRSTPALSSSSMAPTHSPQRLNVLSTLRSEAEESRTPTPKSNLFPGLRIRSGAKNSSSRISARTKAKINARPARAAPSCTAPASRQSSNGFSRCPEWA